MTKIKRAITGVSLAASSLLIAVFSQFGIQELIETATGWRPPYWIAVTIAAVGVAGAIVEIVASCGVAIPKWVAIAAASGMGIAA